MNLATKTFGTATFFNSICVAIYAFIILFIIFKMYKKFAHKDLIDICEFIGGKYLKIIVGVIISIFLVVICALASSELIENIKIVLFNDAPRVYIASLFAITVFIGSISGLKSILKVTTLIAPAIILSVVLMFFTLYKNIDFTNFYPLFGNGIGTFLIHGLINIARYKTIFFIFLIIPKLKNYQKIGYTILSIDIAFNLIITFLLVGIMPYPAITENSFPIFELTRLVSVGRFIERVESIFILFWLMIGFIYLSTLISLSASTFAKTFNIKNKKIFILIFLLIVLLSNILFSSYENIIIVKDFIFTNISPYLLFRMPTLLLVIATFKRRYLCKKSLKQN